MIVSDKLKLVMEKYYDIIGYGLENHISLMESSAATSTIMKKMLNEIAYGKSLSGYLKDKMPVQEYRRMHKFIIEEFSKVNKVSAKPLKLFEKVIRGDLSGKFSDINAAALDSRKRGYETFMFNGKTYTTHMEGEDDNKWKEELTKIRSAHGNKPYAETDTPPALPQEPQSQPQQPATGQAQTQQGTTQQAPQINQQAPAVGQAQAPQGTSQTNQQAPAAGQAQAPQGNSQTNQQAPVAQTQQTQQGSPVASSPANQTQLTDETVLTANHYKKMQQGLDNKLKEPTGFDIEKMVMNSILTELKPFIDKYAQGNMPPITYGNFKNTAIASLKPTSQGIVKKNSQALDDAIKKLLA